MQKLTILLMALTFGLLTACETVEGVGQDVTNAGRAMKRTF